jgi:formyl-CoA transferase
VNDTASAETSGPLDGVRVLELGNYIAAPTAGRLLADFGAEVIKVERPRVGDELRSWRLYAGETSMLFRTINRNKKSICLDLKSDAGRHAVRELIRTTDVLLENFRPGMLEKWGLSPDALMELNPELVVVRVSAFGQTGPRASEPGFGVVAEAMGGLRELTGDPDRAPSRVGVSIGDSLAGLHAAFGAMLQLFDRERRRNAGAAPASPTERTVDVALSESVLSVMESLVPDFDAYGVVRERTGGRMQGIAPTNAYRCGDGRSVVIGGNGDSIYGRFMRTIGRPDLADDPDLQSNATRWERRDELDAAIEEWTTARTVGEVVDALGPVGVPATPIYTAADIVADPQFLARDMVQSVDVVVDGAEPRTVRFPGVVPRVGGVARSIRNLGPDLGADTRDVLSSLPGLSAEERDELLGTTAAAATNGDAR